MQRKKDKKIRGIQIGISSLVLIFTVLCLVIFSVLSITSANADYKLSKKAFDGVNAYYMVDGEGEFLKKQVNEKILKMAKESGSQQEFESKLAEGFSENFDGEKNALNFSVESVNEQLLLVGLDVFSLDKVRAGQENFKVRQWKIVNKVEYEIDNDIPVWVGE